MFPFQLSTSAPATLEESCEPDTTLSNVSRKRSLSLESVMLPPIPIKFRYVRGDWDLATRTLSRPRYSPPLSARHQPAPGQRSPSIPLPRPQVSPLTRPQVSPLTRPQMSPLTRPQMSPLRRGEHPLPRRAGWPEQEPPPPGSDPVFPGLQMSPSSEITLSPAAQVDQSKSQSQKSYWLNTNLFSFIHFQFMTER